MKKLILTLLAMGLAIGLIVMIGCSDDEEDKGTGPETLPTGDTLDPLYLEARGPLLEAREMVPTGLVRMMTILDSISNLPLKLKTEPDELDSLWYNSDNLYWYAEERGFNSQLGMAYYAFDSLQLVHGGTPAQWPNPATLTQLVGGGFLIHTIVTANKGMAGDTGAYYSFEGTVTGQPGELASYGDVTVNGSGSIYFFSLPVREATQFMCDHEIYDEFQATNIQVDLQTMGIQFCPYAGDIVHNAVLDLYCFGDTTFTNTDNWYFKETYVGDTVHYVIENSFYHWAFSRRCLTPQ